MAGEVEAEVGSPSEAYVHYIPEGRWTDHFSSLLFSADPLATAIEVFLLSTIFLLGGLYPEETRPHGSMDLLTVASAMLVLSLQRRLYNSYLEAVYCSFPGHRTQPVAEHALKKDKDLTGRERKQVAEIVRQDRKTLVSQFMLELCLFALIPGYYPAAQDSYGPLYLRVLRLLANHYIMSLGMYWLHRSLHRHPWLWQNIHSFHHWARHPLSRTTYQDHWLDNFGNAIVGHCFAQVLLPLDHQMFWVSRSFRVCESLEKHSGVSCSANLAHTAQRWLPYAQMPHHHDWHHEGHKGCNYTFSSLGGLWDCIFQTRRTGRKPVAAATSQDLRPGDRERKSGGLLEHPYICLSPVLCLAVMAGTKLYCQDGAVL